MVLIRINNYSFLVLLLLLLLFSYLPLGIVEGLSGDGSSFHKDGARIKTVRKYLVVNAMLDYDDAGANTKHDPRKGGKPGGGKNP